MATATFDRPILDLEGVAQITLSTTAEHRAVPVNAAAVKAYGSALWKLKFAPKLRNVVYYSASGGSYTDYTANATDGSSSTHVPLDAMATGDYVYLNFAFPTRGIYIDMGSNVNAETATLDVEYCSTPETDGVSIAFTDVAGDSDGTDDGGATLGQDGLYEWTLPTAWKRSTYKAAGLGKGYIIRFKPSAALSATVDINEIIPAAKNTNYDQEQATTTYIFHIDTAQVGALEYLANVATPTLDLTWLKY